MPCRQNLHSSGFHSFSSSFTNQFDNQQRDPGIGGEFSTLRAKRRLLAVCNGAALTIWSGHAAQVARGHHHQHRRHLRALADQSRLG
jgi:hypothetical protein